MNKIFIILFIGIAFFSLGCAKKEKEKKEDKATITYFPRFSADALDKAINGPAATPSTNSPQASTANKAAIVRQLSLSIVPLSKTFSASPANKEIPDDSGINPASDILFNSKFTIAALNLILESLDKTFNEFNVTPTTGSEVKDYGGIGTYQYKNDDASFSTVHLITYPDEDNNKTQTTVIWNKENKNVLFYTYGSEQSEGPNLMIFDAYQDASGSFDILMEVKNYNQVDDIDIQPFQKRLNSYIAYDATSNNYALSSLSLQVDTSSALYDELNGNSQTFNKQNISYGYSYITLGNATDNISFRKQLRFATKDNADDSTSAYLHCINKEVTDHDAPIVNCKGSLSSTKIFSNTANYNPIKKLFKGDILNNATYINYLLNSSEKPTSKIGKYLGQFNSSASAPITLGTIYSDLLKN